MKIAITETMEQVHKHCEKYLALHREQTNVHAAMVRAIRERWPEASPAEVLEQAEVNSLTEARNRSIFDQKKNPWVDTTAQGDLFHNFPLRVPTILMVDGKPRPYYEASILDGREWWRARRDAKRTESNALAEAANVRDTEARAAEAEVEKLDELVREATDHGIDPRTVKYAKKA